MPAGTDALADPVNVRVGAGQPDVEDADLDAPREASAISRGTSIFMCGSGNFSFPWG
jgi:hypothetical protein